MTADFHPFRTEESNFKRRSLDAESAREASSRERPLGAGTWLRAAARILRWPPGRFASEKLAKGSRTPVFFILLHYTHAMKAISIFVAMLILASALYAGDKFAGKGTTEVWQYKVIFRSTPMPKIDFNAQGKLSTSEKELKDFAALAMTNGQQWEKELQEAGQGGWELITVTETKVDTAIVDVYGATAYLKRRQQ
jgi:hypothetical protein